MSNNEKKNDLLKKINEINSKIENERINIKHNNSIKDELNKINDSYNRCLDILSQSASGKNINQKYNNLYTENRNNYIKQLNNIDNQVSQSQKNIESYVEEKDILTKQYKEENPHAKVFVIDSLSAGPELTLLIEKLEELIGENLPFEEICEKLPATKNEPIWCSAWLRWLTLPATAELTPSWQKSLGCWIFEWLAKPATKENCNFFINAAEQNNLW